MKITLHGGPMGGKQIEVDEYTWDCGRVLVYVPPASPAFVNPDAPAERCDALYVNQSGYWTHVENQ